MNKDSQWSVRSAQDIGRAIGEIRRTSGLTQQQLAEQTGLTRETLAQLEAGRTGRVIDQTLRLLRRLGANVTITFEGRDGKA